MSSERARVVIMGRPNVGKSSLFNRLYGRRRALVHDEAGVTRDRLEEEVTWWVRARPLAVTLIDTGGLGGDRFAQEIKEQVQIALESADVILMLLDAQAGVVPGDREILIELKKSGLLDREGAPPVIGVINKVDHDQHEDAIHDFYELGLSEMYTISAEHNRGIDEVKDAVWDALPDPERFSTASAEQDAPFDDEDEGESEERDSDPEDAFDAPKQSDDWEEIPDEESADEDNAPVLDRPMRIAIVGRPNVGKSTMVNAFLDEKRMITSPIAGTTVDSIDTPVELEGRPYVLIDTAGIRRKNKTEQGIEVLSVVQTRKALERADVAVLLLDGEGGLTEQDEKIGGLIEEVGCGVVLAMNKWDTQRNNPKFTQEEAAEQIRDKMPFLRYAPIVFTSGIQARGLDKLPGLFDEILRQRGRKVQTREFTEWVRAAAEIHNPMNAKFYMCHQASRHPPTFVLHVSDPKKVHFSLSRHIINGIRERWGFMGNPVRLVLRQGQGRAAKTPNQLAARSRRR